MKKLENKKLYEYFGLKNENELFSKIREKDPLIEDLLIFLNDQKKDIDTKNMVILNRDDLLKYINTSEKLPEKGKITVLYCDVKKRVTSSEIIDFKDGVIKALRDFAGNLYKYKSQEIFLIRQERSTKGMEEFLNKLRNLSLELKCSILDEVLISGSTLTIMNDRSKKVEISKSTIILEYQDEYDFSKSFEYNTFIKTYSMMNLIGLDLEEDANEIDELLKIGYQNLEVEHFGAIIVDMNKKIIDVKDLTIGTLNMSLASPINLLGIINKNKNSDGLILYHNHPSGKSNPSSDDIDITRKFGEILKTLEYNFYDHRIIAKDKVFSIAETENMCNVFSELNLVMQVEPKKIEGKVR